MKKYVIKFPLENKILWSFFTFITLFMIFGLKILLNATFEEMLILDIPLGICIIIFIHEIYILFTKIIIEETYIKIKHPMRREKILYINKIIGYTVSSGIGQLKLTIFFDDNERFLFRIIGKKMINAFTEFTNEIKDDMNNRYLKLFNENGLKFKLNRKSEIFFMKDSFKIIKNDKSIKQYYYKTDIFRLDFKRHNNILMARIITKDNEKIIINEYMLNGGMVLLEYLQKECIIE